MYRVSSFSKFGGMPIGGKLLEGGVGWSFVAYNSSTYSYETSMKYKYSFFC